MAIKSTSVTLDGLKYNLDDRDRVAAQLVNENNNNFTGVNLGIVNNVLGTATALTLTAGAQDTAYTITQPANTALVDAGVIVTVAVAGSSGNINIKIGTDDDGAQIAAAAALMSSATAVPIGVVMSTAGQGEGAAFLAFAADAALHTTTERTLYIRAEASATVTAGTLLPYISFIKTA
jgi:hypothetical protein